MKFGILRIRKDSEIADYKKSGYYWNQLIGCPIAKDGTLLPFFYAFADTGSTITVSSFKLQQIDRDGNVFSDCDYNLKASYITTENNDQHKVFKYAGDHNILDDLTSYNNGIYRYKIIVNSHQVYYSAPFEINDYKYIATIGTGDFDPADFYPVDFY